MRIPEKKSNLSVTLDTKYYEYLKKLSIQMGYEQKRKIGLSELVRRALENRYPIPMD